MKYVSMAFLVCALLVQPSYGGWGGGDCGPVGPGSFTSPVSVEYQWVRVEPGEYALLLAGRQVGALRAKDRAFFALLGTNQWMQTACPCQLPEGLCQCPGGCSCPPDDCHCGGNCSCKKQAEVKETPPCGVESDKVESGKHIHNGRSVSKREIMEAIKASVPVDQNKLRLTVIGDKNATDAVLRDLKGLPEASDFQITAYTPDHWAVKDNGLAAGRPFTIAVLAPDGKVLHRQWDYQGGVQALSEALRDAKESYDPTKDPDLRKRDVLSVLAKEVQQFVQGISAETWLLLAVGGVLLFNHYRKDK